MNMFGRVAMIAIVIAAGAFAIYVSGKMDPASHVCGKMDPASGKAAGGRVPWAVDPMLVYRWAHSFANVPFAEIHVHRYVDPHAGVVYLPPVHAGWVTREEKHVLEIFNHLRCPQLFVDVGANDGTFSLLAAKRGCPVVSFELQLQCIELMTSTLGFNGLSDANVTIVNRPVADVPHKILTFKDERNLKNNACSGAFRVGCSEKITQSASLFVSKEVFKKGAR